MPDKVFFVGPLDRVLYLKTLPVFESLSSNDLVAIARHTRERFFPRDSLLVRQGELPTASYIVLEGRIQLTGNETERDVEGGEAIGLLELLAETPFPWDARAETDALVLEFDAEAQRDLWEDRFPIMYQYLSYLGRKTIDAIRKSGGRFSGGRDPLANLTGGSLNFVERILTLQQVPMLSSSSVDALAELSAHVDEDRFAPGEELWREGDEAEDLWILLAGRVRASWRTSAGMLEYGAGSSLGLEEILGRRPRWSDARVEEGIWTLRIARDPLIDVVEDHFPLALHIVSAMAQQLLGLGAPDPPVDPSP